MALNTDCGLWLPILSPFPPGEHLQVNACPQTGVSGETLNRHADKHLTLPTGLSVSQLVKGDSILKMHRTGTLGVITGSSAKADLQSECKSCDSSSKTQPKSDPFSLSLLTPGHRLQDPTRNSYLDSTSALVWSANHGSNSSRLKSPTGFPSPWNPHGGLAAAALRSSSLRSWLWLLQPPLPLPVFQPEAPCYHASPQAPALTPN